MAWETVDLLAAARVEAQGPRAEVVPQVESHLVLFRFDRSPRFEELLAALDGGNLAEDPAQIERQRKSLRARAILPKAAQQRGRS
jgi:hypothetical protein